MRTLWELTKPTYVPDISDERIAEMRKQISPLIKHDNRYYRIRGIDELDAREQSYIWGAECDGEPMLFGPLETLKIMTFHKWGAPALFKPSLAEVYSSIDRFIPDTGFIGFFCLQSDNLGPQNVIGDCHWCVCELLGSAFVEGEVSP